MVRFPPILRRWMTLLVIVFVVLFVGSRIIVVMNSPSLYYYDEEEIQEGLWDGLLQLIQYNEEREESAPLANEISSYRSLQWYVPQTLINYY